MSTHEPGSPVALILQFAILVLGIGLLVVNRYWNRGPAVDASGVFFINLFWITMVLTYDLSMWSALRNTLIGGLILIGIVVINLIVIAALALFARGGR